MSGKQEQDLIKEDKIFFKTLFSNSDKNTLIANSIKSKYKCESERMAFIVGRSFKLGKIYDPDFIFDETSNFLNCHLEVVKQGQTTCNNQMKGIVNCLNKYFKSDFPVECVEKMEDYMKC